MVKDQETVRIDPNRKHTLAEVRLVMEVYGYDERRALFSGDKEVDPNF